MKMTLTLLAILTLAYQDWIDYSNKDYHFEIKLPKGYEIKQDKNDEKFAAIEYIRISSEEECSNGIAKGIIIFRVICEKYKKNQIITEKKLNFYEVINDYVKYQNESAFAANKMTIKSKKESKDSLYYIASGESLGIIEHRKIVIKNNTSYCLSIMSRKEFLKDDIINSFFNSFKIID